MKKEYKILLAASLLANFGGNLIGPFYAVYVKNIGGSILDIGYTTTIFSIGAGCFMILIGKISDKLNKELITIFGYLLYACGSLGYLIIQNPWQLFLLQVIFSFAVACLSAPLSSLYARYINKEQEGLQWGLDNGGTMIVVGLSVFIGTFIVNRWGFNLLFLSMFFIQLFGALFQGKLYLESRKTKASYNTE